MNHKRTEQLKRPNILLIMSDQHHAGVMGCAGDPIAQTPNIDRLARDSVKAAGLQLNASTAALRKREISGIFLSFRAMPAGRLGAQFCQLISARTLGGYYADRVFLRSIRRRG